MLLFISPKLRVKYWKWLYSRTNYILSVINCSKKTFVFFFSARYSSIIEDCVTSAQFNLHQPSTVEKNEKGQKKRRRCVLCSARGLGQKRTDVFCSICPGQPALCPDPCFIYYHVKKLKHELL